MPCYSPLDAWQHVSGGEILFSEKRNCRALKLPCGQCVGCRLERSRQWAVRCLHESQMHKYSCFVTLTYDDDHLPAFNSLEYRHFQLFMKRLRKHFAPIQVRFFMCGEYGERHLRPHFHACIFGADFVDRVLFRNLDSGCRLYTSAILATLWPFGFSSIGDVTFESAAYVARYVMKKVSGDPDVVRKHYSRVSEVTGEVVQVQSEFCRMSLRPGVGASWFDRFSSDVFPHDYVILRGRKCKPPRFYDGRLKVLDEDAFEELKCVRYWRSPDPKDSTRARLAVREQVVKAALRSKVRVLED